MALSNTKAFSLSFSVLFCPARLSSLGGLLLFEEETGERVLHNGEKRTSVIEKGAVAGKSVGRKTVLRIY